MTQTAIVPYGAAELRARVNDLRTTVMQKDIDFGLIPGVDKMVLLKPGAEKLCAEFGFYPRFEQISIVENFDPTRPLFHYRYRAILYRIGTDDAIAEGIGSCNSMEKKYRYRNSERVCPQCGQPAIIKGKADYGGGWVCFKKKGGCGAKFSDHDAAIVGQEVGQVENPDIFDQINTLDKMAQKRALIAAVLIATNASAYFTQDLEDYADVVDGHYEEVPSNRTEQAAGATNGNGHTNTRTVTLKSFVDVLAKDGGGFYMKLETIDGETVYDFDWGTWERAKWCYEGEWRTSPGRKELPEAPTAQIVEAVGKNNATYLRIANVSEYALEDVAV